MMNESTHTYTENSNIVFLWYKCNLFSQKLHRFFLYKFKRGCVTVLALPSLKYADGDSCPSLAGICSVSKLGSNSQKGLIVILPVSGQY